MASAIASSLGIALAALLVATSVRADPPSIKGPPADPVMADHNLAQSLFEEGRKLLDAGKVGEACDKFTESERLDPGGGTLLNLALCHDKLGKIATAYAEYNEALSLALRDKRDDRAKFAEERIAALKPKLPRVTIALDPANGPDVTVKLDTTTLPRAAMNVPTPVDPGVHAITANAPGRAPFSTDRTVIEGDSITVTIPPLSTEYSPPPALMPLPQAPPDCPAGYVMRGGRCLETVEHMNIGGTKFSTASWVVTGMSGAALAASLLTGALALSAMSDARSECAVDRSYCPNQDGIDAAGRARTLAWVSTGALIGSGALLITALILPRTKVQPNVARGISLSF